MRRPNLTPPRPVSREPRAVGTRATAAQVSLPDPPSFAAVRNTVIGLGVLVLGGIFVGAPYKSAEKLGKAIESGDAAKLEEVIDFPALREDLKGQVAAALGGLPRDPARSGAPDVGDALALAGSSLVNGMIDAAVRPEVFAHLKDAPIDEDLRARARLAVRRARVGYDDPMSFSIRVVLVDVSDQPIRLTMRRTGLLTWKLKSISVPSDLKHLEESLKPEFAPGVEEIAPGKYRALVRVD